MRRWTALAVIVSVGALSVAPSITPVTAGATTTTAASESWAYPNGDLANTRVATTSTIDRANISTLIEAWSHKLTGTAAKVVDHLGTMSSNPIIVDGAVFVQDFHNNVYALSLTTGKVIWSYIINKKELSGPGPNGVAVSGGLVYGASPRNVFALNAHTGKRVWLDSNILKKGQGTFGIQPTVANGRLFIASQYGKAKGGGVILALNATTGKKLWTFHTVPTAGPGVTALGVGAGGAWETPLVGTDGSVSFGVGNPYQTLESGITTPAKILYTDSIVNLNAATGKLRWYYQAVPNDFKDYDLQDSPIAASVRGTPVVLGAGKMGFVYEMNAKTGKLLWKTSVGIHNGHDNDSLKALKGSRILSVPFTYEPGALGGVLSNMSEYDGTVYVATGNVPFKFTNTDQVNGTSEFSKATGDVEALNLATGKVEWKTAMKSFPMGGTTVSNDLVITTTVAGKLLAYNRANGKLVFSTTLPASTISPPSIVGSTIVIESGGPAWSNGKPGVPQIEEYRVATTKTAPASTTSLGS